VLEEKVSAKNIEKKYSHPYIHVAAIVGQHPAFVHLHIVVTGRFVVPQHCRGGGRDCLGLSWSVDCVSRGRRAVDEARN
jgi:hypothetical protein